MGYKYEKGLEGSSHYTWEDEPSFPAYKKVLICTLAIISLSGWLILTIPALTHHLFGWPQLPPPTKVCPCKE